MKYPDFMKAVEMCMEAGEACYCAKSDMSMAFRNVPLNEKSWCYLVLKAKYPITGVTYYFVDQMFTIWSFNKLYHIPVIF